MTTIIQVAVAVLQKDKHILCCQRKKGGRYSLKWEFPGGKVEEGESLIDCLHRELREELSIEFESAELFTTLRTYYDDGGWFDVAYFIVTDAGGEIKNNVFEQIRWVTLDELKNLDVLEGNKPVIEKLFF